MKKVTNANGETRTVVQVDNDGKVWWCKPDVPGVLYDTRAQWDAWVRGER
jgi:hypothetical protein